MKIFAIICISLFLVACSTTSTKISNTEAEANSQSSANATAANYNVQLALGYFDQGDTQRAKQKLLLALDQAPDWAPAHDAMAYYLENTGELRAAEKYYLQAIQIDPSSGSAQNNYGTFLCKMKRYQEADQHFMLAAQDPQYLRTAEVYENAGLCAMQIPDATKAYGYFQKAIAHDPNRAISYLELAQISFNQKNYVQSHQYLAQYFQLASEPGAEALWLGIRLARIQNDTTTAGSYAITLQTKFPDSQELRQLRATTGKNKPQYKGLSFPLIH